MSSVYYLKILFLSLLLSVNVVDKVHGGTVRKYAETITKKILRAKSLPFEDCGSKYLILYLKISSCSTLPCVMHRGTTVQVNVLFDDDGKGRAGQTIKLLHFTGRQSPYTKTSFVQRRPQMFKLYLFTKNKEKSGNNTSYIKHQVRWIFNAIKTQAYITPDPCDGVHQCITNVTDGKSYWASVLVNNTLPLTSGTMLWEAFDEYNQEVICFKVPVVISL